MKRLYPMTATLALVAPALFISTSGVWADGYDFTKTEVSVERVFVPPTGFDDNDQIGLVLDGMLPNGCWEPSETEVTVEDEFVVKVRQFAIWSEKMLCAQPNNLPDFLDAQVPYTLEVPLGRMRAGSYTVKHKVGTAPSTRDFAVDRAESSNVDNHHYAPVENVYIKGGVVQKGRKGKAVLTGNLTSTCMEIAEIKVARQGDVTVVLPIVKDRSTEEGVLCAAMLTPFEAKVELGKFETKGRFLVHTRAMNGRA
ncbi:MAG: hypothetical protein AAB425_01420, partial [Bdellovibrionota bacterium]